MSGNVFGSNDMYIVNLFEDHDAWLKGRWELRGIGGSDSAAALGKSHWKTNLDLWLEKTGRKSSFVPETPAMRYGTKAEVFLRGLFELDVEGKYEVHYLQNVILQNREMPYMLYSPDGLLTEVGTDRLGILEIKTAQIRGNSNQWKDQIPENYFIQVLHGMAVTGADYVELRASLKYDESYTALRTYHIERTDDGVEDSIELIREGIKEFWDSVEKDEEPPLVLPEI